MAASLRTALCDVVGIDVPIIQAGMSVHTSPALVAEVSGAGALGSLGAWRRPAAELADGIRQVREWTDRPFAVNHLPPDLDEDCFALTLGAAPPVISFATGDPGELVTRAHDAGCLVTNQVTTAEQAEQSAELGVDVIIAQGGEAGGYGGDIATTVLVPLVVRRVHPLPVVASGGFVDGGGLVAALAFGACGISVGTRFLATAESPIHAEYKDMLLAAGATDAVKAPSFNRISPKPGSAGYGTVVRVLRTPFVTQMAAAEGDELGRLGEDHLTAALEGRAHQLIAGAGQSAARVGRVEPAADVVRQIVTEAKDVLAKLTPLADE